MTVVEGLGAWGAYHDGRYRSYLMDAQTAAVTPSTSIIPDSLITPDNAKIYITLAIGAFLALKILKD